MSAAPEQPEPKKSMADIHQAVSRREEDLFLSKWPADSEGARGTSDSPPFISSADEPWGPMTYYDWETDPTQFSFPKVDMSLGEQSHRSIIRDERHWAVPWAPTKERFPYLPLRSAEENFQYRPESSFDAAIDSGMDKYSRCAFV
ncbi:hypothetical protein DHEL01_v208920 [Diaporthe helianthi]|uniref:Uncharacterized protein n=1 Tax=Diaporthe helianthi TaxID=158607 RepID=A0A2P5HR51_DIAHE|nr:hypothetical protein DHEL01_v208920 [Diaporthe helianthi]